MNKFYKYIKSIWEEIPKHSAKEFISYIKTIKHMDVIYIKTNPELGQSAALILISAEYPKKYLEVQIYRASSYASYDGEVEGDDWIDQDIKRALTKVKKVDKVVTLYV
jgi:hypothetical protein